jgi:hypothetical protein
MWSMRAAALRRGRRASRLVAGVDVLLAGKEEALQRVLTCNHTRIHQVARYE